MMNFAETVDEHVAKAKALQDDRSANAANAAANTAAAFAA